jgi:hypothetical protein
MRGRELSRFAGVGFSINSSQRVEERRYLAGEAKVSIFGGGEVRSDMEKDLDRNR